MVTHLTALKLVLVGMRMAIATVMVKPIAILSLGSVAQPERLLLGLVVEMITAVMAMIPGTEVLLLRGLQEVVVVIIMAVMVNKAADMVVPQARLVELLHGSDTMKRPRLLRAVKDMGMEGIQVADTVTQLVDTLLNRAWALLQASVVVRVGLVRPPDWVLCSRIMGLMDPGALHHPLHLGMLLLHR